MSIESSIEEQLNINGYLVYTNVGVSMMPLLRQNKDIIHIIKKGDIKPKKYDAVLFKRDNGQYVLHRIIKVRENDYYIVGDNCFKGEYVDEEQILGFLDEIQRNGKHIKIDNKGYRFYVHLWCDLFYIRIFILRCLFTTKKIVKKFISFLKKN